MILIGLGANLPTPEYGKPRATLGAALEAMNGDGIIIRKRAPWYESAPVPMSDQPWYVNGLCQIDTDLPPQKLVDYLLQVETRFGRQRALQNAPRILDLDLIAYGDVVISGIERAHLTVPHPRMSERAFVVLPLRDIAPEWHHPESEKSAEELEHELPADQITVQMVDASGLYGTEWPGSGPV